MAVISVLLSKWFVCMCRMTSGGYAGEMHVLQSRDVMLGSEGSISVREAYVGGVLTPLLPPVYPPTFALSRERVTSGVMTSAERGYVPMGTGWAPPGYVGGLGNWNRGGWGPLGLGAASSWPSGMTPGYGSAYWLPSGVRGGHWGGMWSEQAAFVSVSQREPGYGGQSALISQAVGSGSGLASYPSMTGVTDVMVSPLGASPHK
jgi:hypothetical protein